MVVLRVALVFLDPSTQKRENVNRRVLEHVYWVPLVSLTESRGSGESGECTINNSWMTYGLGVIRDHYGSTDSVSRTDLFEYQVTPLVCPVSCLRLRDPGHVGPTPLTTPLSLSLTDTPFEGLHYDLPVNFCLVKTDCLFPQLSYIVLR